MKTVHLRPIKDLQGVAIGIAELELRLMDYAELGGTLQEKQAWHEELRSTKGQHLPAYMVRDRGYMETVKLKAREQVLARFKIAVVTL